MAFLEQVVRDARGEMVDVETWNVLRGKGDRRDPETAEAGPAARLHWAQREGKSGEGGERKGREEMALEEEKEGSRSGRGWADGGGPNGPPGKMALNLVIGPPC